MYCPSLKKINENVVYVDESNSFIKQINENAMISKILNKTDRFFFFHKRRKIFKDIKKKIEFNIDSCFIAHSLFTDGYVANMLYKKFHTSFSVFIQNTDISIFFEKYKFLRKKGLEIILNSKRMIVVSEKILNYILTRYIPVKFHDIIREKTLFIPFGIDDIYFKENPPIARNIDFDEINILSVGTINKNKNQIAVANAIELLKATGYNIKYNIVGSIDDNEVFNDLKQYSFFQYLGKKSGLELIQEYRKNDIFVMPSILETFGLVYAEALSQGIPIVYSHNQGFDGLFPEGLVGFSVDPLNSVDIAHKIQKILKEYSGITINCIQASKKFEWHEIALGYYKSLLD